jgi:hypothetical protein
MEKALTTGWGRYGDGSIRDVFCTNAGMDVQGTPLYLRLRKFLFFISPFLRIDYDCSSPGGFQSVFRFS